MKAWYITGPRIPVRALLRSGWLVATIVTGCSAAGSAPTAAGPGSATIAPASAAPSAASSSQAAASSESPTSPTPTAAPPDASPTPTAARAATVDYRGSWTGQRLFGTIKWCGGAKSPYWAEEVHAGPDQGFVAYDIPPGSDHAAADIVTSFVDPAWNKLVAGTGTFVPGNPPHFVIVNGEGRFDVTLEVGKFCGA